MGFEVNDDQEIIKETVDDYENYKQIQLINGVWEYSEIDFERKSPPEKVNIINFNHNKQAYRYFFLNLLKSSAFNKAFIKDNPVYNISSIKELEHLFIQMNLPRMYYNFSNQINSDEIHVEFTVDKKVIVNCINCHGNKILSTRPLELERGILSMYRITRYYCILKETEHTLIENQLINEAFNDEDVKWFIK